LAVKGVDESLQTSSDGCSNALVAPRTLNVASADATKRRKEKGSRIISFINMNVCDCDVICAIDFYSVGVCCKVEYQSTSTRSTPSTPVFRVLSTTRTRIFVSVGLNWTL
jgi:hypothetical protein